MSEDIEYGVAANDYPVRCHWCGELVRKNEKTVEVSVLGFYGHVQCFENSRQGLSRKEIRERYLRGGEK